MNLKLRLKNKTTLLALIGVIITFVYQICGLFGVVPSVSESDVTNYVGLVINLLVALGVVVDPTTAGISDSERAMGYEEPNTDCE